VYSNVTFCFSFWGTKYPGSPTGFCRWTPLGILSAIPKIPLFDPYEKLLNLSTWTLVGTAIDPRGGHRNASRFVRLETPLSSRRFTIWLHWRFWYNSLSRPYDREFSLEYICCKNY